MAPVDLPSAIAPGAEPIPGYVLQEQIGEGGFGEVWKAVAPGGLTKAVKFVYGHLEGSRAARELKSLNHIKAVHHPFLLSLERIEVVDGRLVIVSELADLSLRDRFMQCRERNLAGIPARELLVYVRDTADALDYLYSSKSVQHLDVKPENLLLVGNRVKVADFGLVRDIHDRSASLASFTPAYTPPEVFDGRTDQHSDQYSLAIVFQEMLTGRLPFDGRTPAQLAAQHLGGPPNVSPLPEIHRHAVLRALSKDAKQRFGSCGEFVDGLLSPTETVVLPGGSRPLAPLGPIVADGPGAPAPDHPHDGHTIVVKPPEIKNLPAISLPEPDVSLQPTVFVGIGGTAGRVLRHLRRRLVIRFGKGVESRAIQMLQLDTDIDTLKECTSGDGDDALRHEETLWMPLRQAKVYREHMTDLESISRRWIYSIPRSLRTEGIRPLGRMALLDHSQSVLRRLESVIATATDRDGIGEPTEGGPDALPAASPRVFVVASISGGTGSGMVLDVGYAVRQVLAQLSIPDGHLCGVLTHSTRGQSKSHGLAAASAYACLSELHYFTQPSAEYPGEPSRGLDRFRQQHGPFDSTYIVHLGEDLNDGEFDRAAEQLAEYLYLNSHSPTRAFFEECRRSDSSVPGGSNHGLRTMGLYQLSEIDHDLSLAFAEVLSRELVLCWVGKDVASTQPRHVKLSRWRDVVASCERDAPHPDRTSPGLMEKVDELVRAYARDQGLDVVHLSGRIRGLAEQELGSRPDAYFRRVVDESLARAKSPGDDAATETLWLVDAILGGTGDTDALSDLGIETLPEAIATSLDDLGNVCGTALQEWLIQLMDASWLRVHGTDHAASQMASYLKSQCNRADVAIRGVQRDALRLQQRLEVPELDSGAPKRSDELGQVRSWADVLTSYAELRLNEAVLAGVRAVLCQIESRVAETRGALRAISANLMQLAEVFDVPPAGEETQDDDRSTSDPGARRERIETLLASHKEELALRLDQLVEAEFHFAGADCRGSFVEAVAKPNVLAANLRRLSRQLTVEFITKTDCAEFEQALAGKATECPELLRRCVESATPRLLACGGATRLLFGVGPEFRCTPLRQLLGRAFNDDPTVVVLPHPDVVLCYEVEGLSAERVAANLIGNQPYFAQLASRLHTRVDVEWSSRN